MIRDFCLHYYMPNNKYCTIYLVRHGQTDWNLAKRIQGRNPVPLNKYGRNQAKQIAFALKNEKISAVYASDIQRTIETAEKIAVEHDLAVIQTKLMRERAYGPLVGHSDDSIPEKLRRRLEKYYSITDTKKRWEYRPMFRHESTRDVQVRTIRFLRTAAVVNLGKNIVVVTHGGVIKIILAALGWVSKDEFYKVKVENTGYAVIDSDGTDFIVKKLHGIKK